MNIKLPPNVSVKAKGRRYRGEVPDSVIPKKDIEKVRKNIEDGETKYKKEVLKKKDEKKKVEKPSMTIPEGETNKNKQ